MIANCYWFAHLVARSNEMMTVVVSDHNVSGNENVLANRNVRQTDYCTVLVHITAVQFQSRSVADENLKASGELKQRSHRQSCVLLHQKGTWEQIGSAPSSAQPKDTLPIYPSRSFNGSCHVLEYDEAGVSRYFRFRRTVLNRFNPRKSPFNRRRIKWTVLPRICVGLKMGVRECSMAVSQMTRSQTRGVLRTAKSLGSNDLVIWEKSPGMFPPCRRGEKYSQKSAASAIPRYRGASARVSKPSPRETAPAEPASSQP
jgi:hypothetical protein